MLYLAQPILARIRHRIPIRQTLQLQIRPEINVWKVLPQQILPFD